MTGREPAADVALRIAGLSPAKRALLERALLDRRTARTGRVPRRAADEPVPLSFAQRGMWFLDQWQPGSSLYGVRAALRLAGPLHVGALRRAFNEITRRHEILRTTFVAVDGRPIQVISDDAAMPVPVVDLTGLLHPAERD